MPRKSFGVWGPRDNIFGFFAAWTISQSAKGASHEGEFEIDLYV